LEVKNLKISAKHFIEKATKVTYEVMSSDKSRNSKLDDQHFTGSLSKMWNNCEQTSG